MGWNQAPYELSFIQALAGPTLAKRKKPSQMQQIQALLASQVFQTLHNFLEHRCLHNVARSCEDFLLARLVAWFRNGIKKETLFFLGF